MRTAIRTIMVGIVALTAWAAVEAQSNSLQFRFGGYVPRGEGEFWVDTEDAFTIKTSDFRDPVVGFTYVASVNHILGFGVNADYFRSTVTSGYRDFVDDAGYPILHDSALTLVPLSVDLRIAPTGAYGDRDPRYASRRPTLYLGGGVGLTLYQYEEVGDFIDFDDPTLPVVFDRLQDDGAAFQAHALAGLDIPVGVAWGITLEAKYAWSEAELQDDFAGFGTIDLSGLTVSAGVSFRF